MSDRKIDAGNTRDDNTPTRQGRSRTGRRSLLRGMALGAAAPLVPGTITAAGAAPSTSVRGSSPVAADAVSFRWLGTSGWRIETGGRTVLFDPYVTRYRTGLFEGAFDPATGLESDPALVREHTGRPELVLVSHSHWDHLSDVPHIAKSTGARVVGTETTFHLLVALGVDPDQVSVVKGGEVLDFDGFVVEVTAGLHSRNKKHAYFAPGTLHAPPAATPSTISDLLEGDTLSFQLTIGDNGPSAFLMGASDFSQRAVQGLRPDIAMVALPASSSTHRYVPRLLNALGNPGVVVPVHWDNFEKPLSEPPRPDPSMDLDAFAAQVRRTSPGSRLVLPDYRTTYDGAMRPTP